jgi:hypothetical protein
MSQWTPEWQLTINGGGDYTNLTLSNLTITSGRQDIYSQPYAGYCNVEIINLDLSPIEIDINDQINIKVKDSTGTYVNVFGGYVSDIDVEVTQASSTAISERIRVIALGALSKLPKTLTEGVLSKDFDGDQIYAILSEALFDTWNEVPAAETWAGYDPTTTWENAENSGLGEIDQPGDYELTSRSSSTTDIYSLVSSLATSGLGYLYEDSQGRIGYADSTHRSEYLAANGYVDLTGNHALSRGIRTQSAQAMSAITSQLLTRLTLRNLHLMLNLLAFMDNRLMRLQPHLSMVTMLYLRLSFIWLCVHSQRLSLSQLLSHLQPRDRRHRPRCFIKRVYGYASKHYRFTFKYN